jgi:hypothetical protein
MVVVDRPVALHREIDMVTTPSGDPVAMVHCNNCTSDLNAWISLFQEVIDLHSAAEGKPADTSSDKKDFFGMLFRKALEGDADCGGLLNYNYISGTFILSK